jgi:hypothetical protein
MSKSFCSGCKHWKYVSPGYSEPGFWYCHKLGTYILEKRKEKCGSKYKESQNKVV